MNHHPHSVNRLVIAIVVFALLCAIPSMAQVVKGSISGTVTDPQGAVVAGATVKAINDATGATLATTSDSSGSFHFNLIPVGTYRVEMTAAGFKTTVQNGIVVAAGRDSGLGAIGLTVGEVSTAVEVTADAPLIETTQSQVTNTFSGTQLTTFAGITENQGLDNLALFIPGVVAARDNGFSNTNGGTGFAVKACAAATMTSRSTGRIITTTASVARAFSSRTPNLFSNTSWSPANLARSTDAMQGPW